MNIMDYYGMTIEIVCVYTSTKFAALIQFLKWIPDLKIIIFLEKVFYINFLENIRKIAVNQKKTTWQIRDIGR